MTNSLREFAERVREKVAFLSGGGPPVVVEAASEEEADRLSAEYVKRWGPDADFLVIIWPPEGELSEVAGQSG